MLIKNCLKNGVFILYHGKYRTKQGGETHGKLYKEEN